MESSKTIFLTSIKETMSMATKAILLALLFTVVRDAFPIAKRITTAEQICTTDMRIEDFKTGALISVCECYRMQMRHLQLLEQSGDMPAALELLADIQNRYVFLDQHSIEFCPTESAYGAGVDYDK